MGLFIPFCAVLVKESADLKAKLKSRVVTLAITPTNSCNPQCKYDFRAAKDSSLPKKSSKKPGVQQDHKGLGTELGGNINEIIPYQVAACPDCEIELRDSAADRLSSRQVEAIPPIPAMVMEHTIELETCPCCNIQWQRGGCPAEIKQEFQFGPGIKAVSVYVSAYPFIPLLRTKQMIKVFGVKLSTGKLDNFRKSAFRNLPNFLAALHLSIIDSAAGLFAVIQKR